MRKCVVSLFALGLFLGATAVANAAGQSGTTTGQAGTTVTGQTGTTADQMQAAQTDVGIDSEQLKQAFGEAGFEQGTEIEGHLARATTSEGHQVLVFVGPRDLSAEAAAQVDDGDFRGKFEGSGFTDLQVFEDTHLVRADFDENHYIVALAADRLSSPGIGGAAQTGMTGQTGMATQPDTTGQSGDQTGETTGQLGAADQQATDQLGSADQQETVTGQTDLGAESGTSGEATGQLGAMDEQDTATGQPGATTGQASRALAEIDADRIISEVEQAGVEEAEQFQGRILKAMSEEGAPVYMLIAPKDMSAQADLQVDEADVRSKLEEAGFRSIEFVEDARIVRGQIEDNSVFVLAGRDFMSNGAGLDTTQQ